MRSARGVRGAVRRGAVPRPHVALLLASSKAAGRGRSATSEWGASQRARRGHGVGGVRTVRGMRGVRRRRAVYNHTWRMGGRAACCS